MELQSGYRIVSLIDTNPNCNIREPSNLRDPELLFLEACDRAFLGRPKIGRVSGGTISRVICRLTSVNLSIFSIL
jgi:hypothetical protein